jgi:hypothetical protein
VAVCEKYFREVQETIPICNQVMVDTCHNGLNGFQCTQVPKTQCQFVNQTITKFSTPNITVSTHNYFIFFICGNPVSLVFRGLKNQSYHVLIQAQAHLSNKFVEQSGATSGGVVMIYDSQEMRFSILHQTHWKLAIKNHQLLIPLIST